MNNQTQRSSLDMESYSLRNMYLSVFVVKTLYLYIGMMFVWTSPLIPQLETSLHISMTDKMAILASLPFGMMLGPITGYFLIPRYGFTSIFLKFGCLSVVSVLLLTFHQVFIISAARLIGGVAIGTVICYMEAYIQNISDDEVRITLTPLNLGFLALGFSFVYNGIGQSLLPFEIILMLLIVPVAFLICLTWLPESPYVYIEAGNLDEAKKSVDFLHRGISSRGLDHLMLKIQESVSKRRSEMGDHTIIPAYHLDPKTAHASLALFILLPLTGFPAVFMLMETLISEAQRSEFTSLSLTTISILILCPLPIATVLNFYCSQRLRLAVMSTIMSMSMAAFGSYFFSLERGQDVSSHLFWLPLVFIFFYSAAFLLGFVHKPIDGVPHPRLRDCGRAITLTAGFFSMFLVTLLFFPLKALLGTGPVLWAFSAFSTVLIFLSLFCSPVATIF